jgi:hypothetical protein
VEKVMIRIFLKTLIIICTARQKEDHEDGDKNIQ